MHCLINLLGARDDILGAVGAGEGAQRSDGPSDRGESEDQQGRPVTEAAFLSSAAHSLSPWCPHPHPVKLAALFKAVGSFGVWQLCVEICLKEVSGMDGTAQGTQPRFG